MNAIQAKFSSARFNRLMFGLGAAILAAGVMALVLTVVGGSADRRSDPKTFGPQAGFNPQLPAHSEPLKNANGRTVRTFWQLDPEVRSTIRTFLATAVARKHLDATPSSNGRTQRRCRSFRTRWPTSTRCSTTSTTRRPRKSWSRSGSQRERKRISARRPSSSGCSRLERAPRHIGSSTTGCRAGRRRFRPANSRDLDL
jgi:hypothetical protein